MRPGTPHFRTAEAAMWAHVARHTGHVGYQRGVKSEGLPADPPAIDCSGWSRTLLTAAMAAENEAAATQGRVVAFEPGAIAAIQFWSDRIIAAIEQRTGWIAQGDRITAEHLPRCAALGIKLGSPEWAKNHPRSRGITHIVQVVRQPGDGAAFVSESLGGGAAPGIRLTPLGTWLAAAASAIQAGEVWAVDPFAMAARPGG